MCITNSKLGSLVCSVDFEESGVSHLDYPHDPGSWYGCPACEDVCHCDEDDVVTLGDDRDMCIHCDVSTGSEGWDDDGPLLDGDSEQMAYESLME